MKKVLLVVLLFSATLLQQSCTSSSGLGSLEGQGGGLGSIASLVRSATGASNAEQMARMETSTVVNALNQTKQELPFMYSPQQGFVVYQALKVGDRVVDRVCPLLWRFDIRDRLAE